MAEELDKKLYNKLERGSINKKVSTHLAEFELEETEGVVAEEDELDTSRGFEGSVGTSRVLVSDEANGML